MNTRQKNIFVIFLFGILALPQLMQGHPNDDALNQLSKTEATWIYLRLGFEHIIPMGLDHILFVLCIFFLSPKLKPVLWQSLAFTLAHSITLGLAMCGVLEAPSYIIEPLIALSIMFLAIENIISDKLRSSRIIIVFLFGLVHGMGFASALGDLGLPQNKFFLSLIMFNVGVELGQLAVILLAWFLVGKWFAQKPWYRKRIATPVSIAIAGIALFWTIQRVFFP
ncbi:MAG: hypothetical protein K0S33_4140 [Bacteroidetes bacterium]|jgi:hypothetical protein|nr:hypothetical protein [Bacteroidota bacterium]